MKWGCAHPSGGNRFLTNGRIEDLRIAAKVLKGRKVKKGIRTIIFPATQRSTAGYAEGLLEIFVEAGAAVSILPAVPAWEGIWGIGCRRACCGYYQQELCRQNGASGQ